MTQMMVGKQWVKCRGMHRQTGVGEACIQSSDNRGYDAESTATTMTTLQNKGM